MANIQDPRYIVSLFSDSHRAVIDTLLSTETELGKNKIQLRKLPSEWESMVSYLLNVSI